MFTFVLYWFSDERDKTHETHGGSSNKAETVSNASETNFGRLTEDVSFSWSLNEDDSDVLDMLFPAQDIEKHQALWDLL